ncbi:vanadium-dependent haloperoxidase [Anaerobacillus sp. CMMVII]|uniref:vanadium-dependent haloperoxidase n=1 Tax=Anaerobacillus sp. CMMVII TaxID=2755588 RepID=UPI0021B7ADD8|nr:vanadium-dependent haloperoxidase [Anaerobacillus sp. CMMVII]MCT8137190.1 vanadium-dependent haloperoxidase [Anaerobacillus sp. CMMVII]
MKKSNKHYKTPKWSKHNAGKTPPIEPQAGSWPLHFFKRNWSNQFTNLDGELVSFKIRNPKLIDFEKELIAVQNTQQNLTDEQREIAKYYGFGPPTKQWTPVIDRLIDTYNVSPVRAARILAATQAAINDALLITWQLKYVFDIARPDQLDPTLETVVPTPNFPAYPSGHATMSGCAEVVLSYFFPGERVRLREIAEQGAMSRLYGCIHFPIDNSEGLRLGRQIGDYIVKELKKAVDVTETLVDTPYKENKEAVLPPPPWEQAIPYPPPNSQPNMRNSFFFF